MQVEPKSTQQLFIAMENDQSDQIPESGGEPTPLLLIAVAVIPLLAIAGWFWGLFG